MAADSVRDDPDFFSPGTSGDGTHYVTIADAEDYSKFIRKPRTAISREYETRVKAMLKAGVFGAINLGDLPDAAAIIHYGPDWAAAVGDLADADERIRKGLDMLTTPANPYAMFLVASIPLATQLIRNHEKQAQTARLTFRQRRAYRKEHPAEFASTSTTFGIPVGFGRHINIRFRFRIRNPLKLIASSARSQTFEPDGLTVKVFSDAKLRAALEKQGIRIQVSNAEEE
jgi:hypothetical protein